MDRGAGIAVAIQGVFAALWLSWGSSNAPSWLSVPLVVAAVLGVLVAVAGVVMARRGTRDPGRSAAGMRSRSYRLIVLVEVLAIAAGAAVLGAGGHRFYIAAWIALVVGVHFFPLAHVFARPAMRVVGALIIVAAVAGFVVGATKSGNPQTVAGTGTGLVLLVSGASLLAVISRRRA